MNSCAAIHSAKCLNNSSFPVISEIYTQKIKEGGGGKEGGRRKRRRRRRGRERGEGEESTRIPTDTVKKVEKESIKALRGRRMMSLMAVTNVHFSMSDTPLFITIINRQRNKER